MARISFTSRTNDLIENDIWIKAHLQPLFRPTAAGLRPSSSSANFPKRAEHVAQGTHIIKLHLVARAGKNLNSPHTFLHRSKLLAVAESGPFAKFNSGLAAVLQTKLSYVFFFRMCLFFCVSFGMYVFFCLGMLFFVMVSKVFFFKYF